MDFGKITVSDGGLVPPGMYKGRFTKVEHLPECEPDPMSGKGGRKYAKIHFAWEITSDGPHKGKTISTDTPVSTGPKSRFVQVAGWLLGKQIQPGESLDITACIGREYGLTHGPNGRGWTEVVHAMPV
jgi:hypothetical protein